jgi:hypothetical protein
MRSMARQNLLNVILPPVDGVKASTWLIRNRMRPLRLINKKGE